MDIRLEIDMNNRFVKEGLYERQRNTADWQELYLSDDTEIEMDVYSPLWNKKDSTRSVPFKVSTEANSWLFGNSETMTGESVYKVLQNRPYRLWVEGSIFLSGIVKLDNSVDVNDGMVDIELRGNQKTFTEQLDGIKARDVEIFDHPKYKEERRTQIGWCMGDEIDVSVKMKVTRTLPNQWNMTAAGKIVTTETAKKTKLVLPSTMIPYRSNPAGDVTSDLTNTSLPYPAKRYCNIRLCMPKHEEYKDKDGNQTFESVRGYHVAEANRTHTSPCFFVMYWLELLMQDLGIAVTRNDMYKEPDLLRLAFAHSSCMYKTDGHQLNYFQTDSSDKKKVSVRVNDRLALEFSSTGNKKQTLYPLPGNMDELFPDDPAIDLNWPNGYHAHTRDEYELIECTLGIPYVYPAYATSDNFPDVDSKDIIEAIENGFNMRFVYDIETNSMKIVFVEDILSQAGYEEIRCIVSKEYKTESDVRGFRLKYKSANEIGQNSITKEKVLTSGNDETLYNYYDFRKTEVIADYMSLFPKIGPTNNTLYINQVTGDAFRIKNDKDVKGDETLLYPSLFEVMGYHDVEIGDCSDSDTTEEVTIGFNPVMVNDTNFEQELKATYAGESADEDGEIAAPSFSVYADCEIHTSKSDSNGKETNKAVEESESWTKVLFQGDSYSANGKDKIERKSVTYQPVLKQLSTESYDPSADHPYDGVDYGFTLGILRDTESSEGLRYFNQNYDKRDNSEWMITSKSNGDFTADSVDQYGNELCSHGKIEHITVNKLNAEAYIRSYFPNSNANLVSADRKVSSTAMHQAGYTNFPNGDYATYYSGSVGLRDHDGVVREFLYTPISDDGKVNSAEDMRAYLTNLETISNLMHIPIMVIDSIRNSKLIASFDDAETAETWANFLHQLGEVYYGDDEDAYIATPVIVDTHIGMSLKLQAEKYNPDSKDKTNNTHGDFPYPISAGCAKRGIYDRRYVNYAYFVINRKVSHMSFPKDGIETAVIRNIDFLKKYKIGERKGWVNRVHYKIGKKTGLKDVTMEMYYI